MAPAASAQTSGSPAAPDEAAGPGALNDGPGATDGIGTSDGRRSATVPNASSGAPAAPALAQAGPASPAPLPKRPAVPAANQSSAAPAPGADDSKAQPADVATERDGSEVIEIRGVAPVPEGNTGSKLAIELIDLPTTLNVVGRDELQERAIDDLDSALEWVAGVNPVFRYGGFQLMTIRGFTDFLVLNDGVRDDRHTFVSSAPQSNLVDVERIEVLKGPSSVLYGYGAIGGAVNLVRKQPSATPSYEFGLVLGVPEARRSSVGLTGPLGTDKLLYRLDVGQSVQNDFRGTGTERNAGTLALAWVPSDRQSLTARFTVNRDYYDTDAGIPTVGGRIPDGVDLDTRYNTPQDRMIYDNLAANLEYRLQVADNVEVNDRLFVARNDYDYFSTEFLQVSESGMDVERGYFFFDRNWRPVINQLEVVADTDTLVESRWLAGYEFAGMWGFSDRSAETASAAVAPVPIFDPSTDPQPEFDIRVDSRDVPRQIVHALYAHHQSSLPYNLELVLGTRLDIWRRNQRRDILDPETGELVERGDTNRRSSEALTYRAGLVYRPRPELATYASYATSFRPSTALPDDGRQLDPEVGRQFEVGQRLHWNDVWQVNVAAYDIAKDDVVIARGMGVFDQAGQQSSRGVEVDLSATPLPWLSLTAGYAYTRSRFDEFERGGMDLSGFRPRFTPEHMANVWVRTRPLESMTVSVGGRYVGESFADPENTIPLPGYAVMDAALTYSLERVRTTLTVNNLLNNRDYFVSGIYSQIYPGPPLTALLALALDY